MFTSSRFLSIGVAIVIVAALLAAPGSGMAASAAELDQGVDEALQKLYAATPAARKLADGAKGILVFPSIVKGGFIVGGQYGEGALKTGAKTIAYYNTVAASYGLQAGLQKYGYAMFLMTDAAFAYLDKSDGWEIGVGPNIVVVDEGAARALTTTSAREDIYVFFFDQKGLMAGLGLQGAKITRIQK